MTARARARDREQLAPPKHLQQPSPPEVQTPQLQPPPSAQDATVAKCFRRLGMLPLVVSVSK
ncbi:hypothetical protein C8Q76DRAFT_797192 [Earliella scabrosa]|nr:hypothetical protein C8Q76DRAFT_797192 [Earliella scabrosa]